MKNLTKHLTDPRKTPQREPIPGREPEMERNAAGGYTFKAGDWERFDRFLIIGTEGGTYYATERELTRESVDVVRRCLKEDPDRALLRIIEVSDQGLAPKNDYAILALALAFCEKLDFHQPRRLALLKVCRTGTHLFQFLEAVTALRGGGRALNGAVRHWIDMKPVEKLALQMVKYRNRAGWTWRDVFRRYRPKPPSSEVVDADMGAVMEADRSDRIMRRALYAWAAGKEHSTDDLPSIAFNAKRATELAPDELAHFVRINRLPHECVPTEHSTRTDVLDALFDWMPIMATVRNLPRLSTYGVLKNRFGDLKSRLLDAGAIKGSRIHPVSLMMAASFYEKGANRNLTWVPDPRVVDLLDDAFQAALKTAEPTGKRILVAIDSSGSMHHASTAAGIELFKIAAAMALTYVRTDGAQVIAFDCEPNGRYYSDVSRVRMNGAHPLALSGRMRVTDAMRAISSLRMGGGTDTSIPFHYAMNEKLDVDAFVVLTDNETWAGRTHHASQALQEYRNKHNPKAKVVWCAMTAGSSECGDPNDPRMLSLAGFDSSAPRLVGDFVADRF